MPPNPRSLANLIPFRKGQTGNPGGIPAWRRELRQYGDFASGVPFDVIDPETGRPFEDPETGQPLNRDDMVMQATFRCAIDIRRQDCTRAQLAWNHYVRGTPKTGEKIEEKARDSDGALPIHESSEEMIRRVQAMQAAMVTDATEKADGANDTSPASPSR